MPLNYNPADHFVRVLAIEPGMEEESKKKVEVRLANKLKNASR